MAESKQSGALPYRLIAFIVGIVVTVVGGYLTGSVISRIISSINSTELVSGLVLFAAGVIILSILISQFFRRH